MASEEDLIETMPRLLTIAQAEGAAAVDHAGEWMAAGGAIRAMNRRGYIEFELVAPEAGMYRIEIEGGSHVPDLDSRFELILSVDGASLGSSFLDAPYGERGSVGQVTPWLQAGAHRVGIFWENAAPRRGLEINHVRLQAFVGENEEDDSARRWVQRRLRENNTLDSFPMSSAVSPVFVEGRGGFPAMMNIANETAGGESPSRHGLLGRWHADVELSPGEPNELEFSFENGGYRERREIAWRETNVLETPEITIRQGDSLLLGAHDPDGMQGESLEIEIEGEEEPFLAEAQSPVAYRFEREGRFLVRARGLAEDGSPREGAMSVEVVGGSFPGSPPLWAGRTRLWETPDLRPQSLVEFDSDVLGDALPEDPNAFLLTASRREDRRVLARLGDGGPVLTEATLRGIDIYGAAQTGAFYGEEYDDGSSLVETTIIVTRAVPGVVVRLDIIVGGVMFDDGTLRKELTMDDFDETGQAKVYFVMPQGVETSNCHTMEAYHYNELLGEY